MLCKETEITFNLCNTFLEKLQTHQLIPRVFVKGQMVSFRLQDKESLVVTFNVMQLTSTVF